MTAPEAIAILEKCARDKAKTAEAFLSSRGYRAEGERTQREIEALRLAVEALRPLQQELDARMGKGQ